jgi:hypothetical protein
MLAKNTTIMGVVLGMLFAARAHAQPDPDSETKPLDAAAAAAGGEGGEQLTLQKGRLVVNAYVGIGLSNGAAFKPISLSPDIWYGVTDDITAGVVHSTVGTSGFMGGAGIGAALGGPSLCLTGSSSGCPDIYNNVDIEGRYRLKMGSIALAADGGVVLENVLHSLGLGVKLGAVARWHQGPLAIEASPNVNIQLTNRGTPADFLNLPATVLYTLSPAITLAGQTGFFIPFESTGDFYAIPLSVGAFYHVNDQLNVTAAFSLPLLIAASGGGIDARSLTLGGSYAF